jgi:hypothetical protein
MKEVPLLESHKGCLPQTQDHFIQGEKMKIKHLYYLVSLLVMLSMLLAACAPQAATATQAPGAQTSEPEATEAPTEAATQAPTEAPTAEPTDRNGGWLDEIDYSVVDGASAISQIQAGAIDF